MTETEFWLAVALAAAGILMVLLAEADLHD